ncbi:MAG: reverse transcriptase domain-containing protein [Candidatus Woesearchaeota archaeon]|nr:reverse transcriptase domain-containing protein [Candidatus Woesearchaeota archaeon]
MIDTKRKDNLGDCQDHTPVCYGESTIKYSCDRNETAVDIQQIGYESSVLSASTSTILAGSMSMATTGLTTTMAALMECSWQSLCSYENLNLAFKKARKRKSSRKDVVEFENNLEQNIEDLRTELLLLSYNPKQLKTFVIKDPKTRTIRKSDFRDRIIHHAICNILEPIFEKRFIYDSFANRKGKGTHKALQRFDCFKRKASRNNTRNCYIFKADIKHYFDEVNHNILISIIKERVKDKRIIWLIKKVLKNHSEIKGMPLGNMTSQFFANVYLNELDKFVKHNIKAKHYIRYVDDFVILSDKREELEVYKDKIRSFLRERLELELHSTKSRIIELKQGVSFLGYRIFTHHRLLRKANIRTMQRKTSCNDYDEICEYLHGWLEYADQADTYRLRNSILGEIENRFEGNISLLEIGNIVRRMEA